MNNHKVSLKQATPFKFDEFGDVQNCSKNISYKQLKNSTESGCATVIYSNVTDNGVNNAQSKNVQVASEELFDEETIQETTGLITNNAIGKENIVGDCLPRKKESYSEAKCHSALGHPLKLEIKPNLTDCPFSVSPSPQSNVYSIKSSPILTRKSSIQFRKLSFWREEAKSKSSLNKKRLTLLGKPVSSGSKNKQNVTYRY